MNIPPQLMHCFGTENSLPVDSKTAVRMLSVSRIREIPVNTHEVSRVSNWKELPLGYGSATWHKVSELHNITDCRPIWNINLAESADEAIGRTLKVLDMGGKAIIKLEVLDQRHTWSLNGEVISAVESLLKLDAHLNIWPLIAPDMEAFHILRQLNCRLIRLMGSPISSCQGLAPEQLATIQNIIGVSHRPDLMFDGGAGGVDDVLNAFDMGFERVLVNSCLFKSDLDPAKELQRIYTSMKQRSAKKLLGIGNTTPRRERIGEIRSDPFAVARYALQHLIGSMDGVETASIGGSAARGHAGQGSDIDILLFDRHSSFYRKEFIRSHDWTIEVHRIPLQYPAALVEELAIIKAGAGSPRTNSYLFGAKRCPHDPRNRSDLQRMFSLWRELQKILDSKPLMQRNGWLYRIKKKFSGIKPCHTTIENALLTLNNDFCVHQAAVLAMQISAFSRNMALSKVLHVDRYLEEINDPTLSKAMRALFSVNPTTLQSWLEPVRFWIEKMIELWGQGIPQCNMCADDISYCHLARCALDHYADANRGLKNGWPIGTLLSLKLAEEYVESRMTINDQTEAPFPDSWRSFWGRTMTERRGLVDTIIDHVGTNFRSCEGARR